MTYSYYDAKRCREQLVRVAQQEGWEVRYDRMIVTAKKGNLQVCASAYQQPNHSLKIWIPHRKKAEGAGLRTRKTSPEKTIGRHVEKFRAVLRDSQSAPRVQSSKQRCTDCGYPLSATDSFCPSCGCL